MRRARYVTSTLAAMTPVCARAALSTVRPSNPSLATCHSTHHQENHLSATRLELLPRALRNAPHSSSSPPGLRRANTLCWHDPGFGMPPAAATQPHSLCSTPFMARDAYERTNSKPQRMASSCATGTHHLLARAHAHPLRDLSLHRRSATTSPCGLLRLHTRAIQRRWRKHHVPQSQWVAHGCTHAPTAAGSPPRLRFSAKDPLKFGIS